MPPFDYVTGCDLVTARYTTTLHLLEPGTSLTLCGRVAAQTARHTIGVPRCKRCQYEAAQRNVTRSDAG